MKIIEEYDVDNQEDREVGIEIEMEGSNLLIPNLSYWEAAGEPSLRGESIEWRLKRPVKRRFIPPRLNYLQRHLDENDAHIIPSDRCGVHIHINCQQMTTPQVITFIVLYLILEDLLVKYCGEDREGNFFCLRAKDAEYLIQELIQAQRTNSLRGLQHDNFRYASINISAIRKFGSLEFRALRTPEGLENINQWVNLLLCIRDHSLTFNHIRDIVEGISAQGEIEFIHHIFGPFTEHIMCENADLLVIDGVRRIQDIAYVRVEEITPTSQEETTFNAGPATPPELYARRNTTSQERTFRTWTGTMNDLNRNIIINNNEGEPRGDN